MYIYGSIAVRGDKVYFVTTLTLSNDPQRQLSFYRLSVHASCVTDGEIAKTWHTSDNIEVTGRRGQLLIPMVGGREALPEFCEYQDIPRPKVRKGTDLRFHGPSGCWQKFTRRDGWVPAE